MLVSAFVGTFIPIFFNAIKIDPAVASGPFITTINDLIAIKINISQTASVYDLFKSGLALNLYGKEPINTKMENATTKDDWKTIIECANTTNTSQPTMAKIVKNQSLQIK